jgi:hypothetical protein
MRGTRVALVLKTIPPYRIGVFQELAKRVDHLEIFISTRIEPHRSWAVEWQALDVSLMPTLTIPYRRRHPGGFDEQLYLHLTLDAYSPLRRYKPDVVIASELGTRSLGAAIYCGLRPECRLVLWGTVSERSEQGRGIFRRWFRPWFIRRADAVVVNGGSGARYVAGLGFPTARIFVARQSPPTAMFADLPLARRSTKLLRILIVGQLVHRKGLLPFLRALGCWGAAHPRRTIELRLAGEGPLRETLVNEPLPKNIHLRFLGSSGYADMPAIYAGADILAFPTLSDEWGLVVNEAMLSGLPVLGSIYSQAVEELVQDGVSGWTFRTDRPDELAGAIERALAVKPAELATMRRRARARALKITQLTMANQLLDAVRFVTAEQG